MQRVNWVKGHNHIEFVLVISFLSLVEFDMEGIVAPDEDLAQEMGDPSVEVTEDLRDKAHEERTQGSMAVADGEFS